MLAEAAEGRWSWGGMFVEENPEAVSTGEG